MPFAFRFFADESSKRGSSSILGQGLFSKLVYPFDMKEGNQRPKSLCKARHSLGINIDFKPSKQGQPVASNACTPYATCMQTTMRHHQQTPSELQNQGRRVLRLSNPKTARDLRPTCDESSSYPLPVQRSWHSKHQTSGLAYLCKAAVCSVYVSEQ